MSHSLRDQLLKTGLVSTEQAKKADKQAKLKTHQQQKKKRKHKKRGTIEPIESDSIAYQAKKALEEDIERAKELNRQKDAQRLEKELQAQVRDLIQRHQVKDSKAEMTYHFVEGDQSVKEIPVNAKQQQQLSHGFLAITVLDGTYYLVPTPIAEKLLERVPDAVVHLNKEEKKTTNEIEDDPYADYPIPDDLMW